MKEQVSVVSTGPVAVPATNSVSKRNSISLFEFGLKRLRGLSAGMGFDDSVRASIEKSYRLLTPGFEDRPVSQGSLWASEISDDHTPIEFSIGVNGTPELRLLVEPMGPSPSLRSSAEVSRALIERIAAQNPSAVDLRRVDKVWDLFVPERPQGLFSVWISSVFVGNREPGYKLYFNPEARGAGRHEGYELVREALERLGLGQSWAQLQATLLRRGPEKDELKYFSLDMSASLGSRVKVYARHQDATIETLETAASSALSYQSGDAKRFLDIVRPRSSFDRRAPQTCIALVEGSERPVQTTLHCPINSYAANDEVVRERVLRVLEHFGISKTSYEGAVQGFRNRELNAGIGMHSYVSFRREKAGPRLSVYLAVEAYRPGAVQS